MNDDKNFDYRTSNSDFATYLLLQGYEYQSIEITIDKKHNDRLKAFIHFKGNKEILIELQDKYENGNVLVEPKLFSITRKKLNKVIKNKLNEYRRVHDITKK